MFPDIDTYSYVCMESENDMDEATEVNGLYNNPQPQLYLLSSSLFQAVSRSFSLPQIHQYKTLREIASLHDIAELEVLRNHLFKGFNFYGLGQANFFPVIDSQQAECQMSREDALEYEGFLKAKLDDTGEIQNILSVYRNEKESNEHGLTCEPVFGELASKPLPPYQVVTSPARVYIVVGEEFLPFLSSVDNLLQFSKDVLKASYTLFSFHQVNQSLWYRLYVKALSQAGANSTKV